MSGVCENFFVSGSFKSSSGFRLRTPAAASAVLSVLMVGFELDWVINIIGGADADVVNVGIYQQ
jgi:hypothetical protein